MKVKFTLQTLHVLFTFVLSIALLSSCSSVVVSYDVDHNAPFSHYSKYTMVPKKADRKTDPRADNIHLNDRFNALITQELLQKGLQEDGMNSDLLISYTFTIRPKMDLMNVNAQVGFSYTSYFRYGGMSSKTCTDISEFDQGLLIIDVRDARTDQLVWRGIGSDIVSIHADNIKILGQIDQIVSKVLAQFPQQ